MLATIDDRHPAAESPEHLPKLESDVSAAQHQQVLGEFGQLQDAGVGEVIDRVESGQGRNSRTRAGIDEDALALEHVVPNANLVWTHEPRFAAIQAQSLPRVIAALLPGP